MLGYFVLRALNTQRPLLTVAFGNVDTPCRFRSVATRLYSRMQIKQPLVEAFLVIMPTHAINTLRCVAFELIKALVQQRWRQVVHQARERLFLIFLCGLTHARKPQHRVSPALRLVTVGRPRVPLSQDPSLHTLRRCCRQQFCSRASAVLRSCPTS